MRRFRLKTANCGQCADMRLLPVLTALLPLAGSAAAASPEALGHSVRLGRTVYVNGPRVTPIRVIEDSRCPMNARCIRAGTVILRVRVAGGRWSRTLDLTLGQPVPVADGSLLLSAVSPDRTAGETLAKRRLRFTFTFEGGI
jgi:hypothetical protein